jgi:hypothetical protein
MSLVFHRDGVPPTMVVDDSKEQTLGEFRRKLREADCYHRVTEPYSPWQQAAEGCICKLKRGSSRKMLCSGLPKPLWDHSLELEALVRSCTRNGIYMIASQVPETIMTDDTADISHIAEFAWFDWVMFRDNVSAYPNNKMTIGQNLGPATDTGSALTSKILKANGQFVCRTTVRPLDNDELQSSVHQKERQDFNQSVFTHLGPAETADDFEAKDLTLDPTYFNDAHIIDPDYGEAEITPEMGDNYLTAELMLPRDGTMVQSHMSARKRDRDGNPDGLADSNPILDTRSYIIDFDDGDQTELTANLIAESLFSQCDPDRN